MEKKKKTHLIPRSYDLEGSIQLIREIWTSLSSIHQILTTPIFVKPQSNKLMLKYSRLLESSSNKDKLWMNMILTQASKIPTG